MKFVANDYEASEILKIIREWSGLTQTELGQSIRRSKRTIIDYESGTTNFSVQTLLEICRKNNIKIIIEK